jgi:hypothetical protein
MNYRTADTVVIISAVLTVVGMLVGAILVIVGVVMTGKKAPDDEASPAEAEQAEPLDEPEPVDESESANVPEPVGVPEPADEPEPESAEKTCPNCGTVNAPGNNFCEQCGTKL